MTRAAIAGMILTVCTLMAEAAPPGRAITVEHAVPFGQIQGKLILYADYLVFVDEAQPADSFVAPKSSIESLTADGAMITVQLKAAVRNRSGEVRRLSFRALDGDPGPVTSWYGSGGGAAPAPAAQASAQPVPEGAKVFPASHNHRIGSCSGRLLITADRVSYESTDSVSHSRRWELKQIRDISLPNPYEINIRAFGESNYKLRLDGSGMDPQTYKEVVDRIAAARALK